MAISHTQVDGSTKADGSASSSDHWSEGLRQAQPIEELFTRFEHYTALAQLALEDLQDQLASVHAAPVTASVGEDLPLNVVPFRPN